MRPAFLDHVTLDVSDLTASRRFYAAALAALDAFHRAALAAGGRDNGAPGLRPRYDAAYYAAFVLDPDGNNIEAVHRGPGSE